jgi:hypothetical protein
MDVKSFNGDDTREFGPAPDGPDRHEPEWDCGCHCPKCLGLLPYIGRGLYASCGDCDGGREDDGEAFRGSEAAAFAREQQDANRLLK